MDHEKEVVDFDQLVRIFVDTDVDTHFIVSLPRTSTVAELRGLVKATHRHCYPDGGDVEIGKLAVPGGDYGYHLADFLLIGQVYDRYEGKVFAEVKDLDPASNSRQGLFRMPALSIKTSSTPKKVIPFAPQPFENGAGEVSRNGSEPGNLLAVGGNACELVVPKLQKEEIDEQLQNCVLGSQEPLDELSRRTAKGCFETIDEEDEKLVELPEPEVSLLPDMCVKVDEITTRAVSSDTQGDTRKRNALECNERPSKSRRLTEPAPSGNTSKAPSEDAALYNAAAASLSHINRSDDLDADYSSSPGSKRRKKKLSHTCDPTVSEGVMHEVEGKEETRIDGSREEKETVLLIGLGEDGNSNGGVGVVREEEEEDPNVLAALASLGKKKGKYKRLRNVKGQEEMTEKKEQEELTEKKEQEEEMTEKKEQEEETTEKKEQKEEMTEKKEKKGKKEKKLKQKEPEQEMELDSEKEPEEVGEMTVKKEKRIKKEKERTKRKQKKQKHKEPKAEKVPEKEKKPEDGQVPVEEKEEMTEKRDKKEKKQKQKEPEQETDQGEPEEEEMTEKKEKKNKEKTKKQKEPEQEMDQEEPEEVEEMMEKKEKKNKKQKKEKKGRKHKSLEQKEHQQEKELEEERMEKQLEEERMEKEEERLKKEKKQEQLVEEIAPLDCPSLNPLLEVSEREPQREDNQVGAAAVSPDISDHAVDDEEDSDDGDVPGSEAKKGRTVGDQDSGRPAFLRDEVSESGTPQREAQVSRDTSEEVTTLHGGYAKALTPKTNLFGDVNGMEISPSYHGGSDPSPDTQGTKTGSVKSQESPDPSKHLSYTGAGRGAPSQTRSVESSRDMMKGKQTGGRNFKAIESQSSQYSEKATQQSEGINLDSEVSGAWLRRGLLDSEPGHIDQSQVAKPAHSSRSGESSPESDPSSAGQTEVSRKDDHVPEASQINHAVKSSEKHASSSAKRSDGEELNIKNDSLEFLSQDQSFHVAPTQVQKALSGSSTEESSDESDDEDTDNLKKQTAGIFSKGGEDSEESSDESRDLATPVRPSFPSLTTKTPFPTVSRMTGNGGSQSFKRRASGVAAEIEAKFAQFIQSQGGLDDIMGITLGQRKRSMPVESSTQGAGSFAMPFGSPLDITMNTQESVKTSPIALDVAQASQSSAEKYATPQFKVPKPVLVGTTSGALRGVLNAAAATAPLPGREAPKAKAVKELRLKRKELTPQVDKSKESGGLLSKKSNVGSLPALEPSKVAFLDKGAAERKAGDSSLSTPPRASKPTIPADLNANESRSLKSSEKKKTQEEKLQDSQFMIVNNTDHISEQEKEVKRQESEEGGSLTVSKKELEMVESGVVGSQEMFVLDSSGKKKKRKILEKEGSRKKRMKFLPEELDGKEVTVLPEDSVERSARETEELYCKLEKANRDLWLQNNSVSSFRKDEEKIGSRAADLDDTEGGEDDVAQSRLVPEVPEVDEPVIDELKTAGPPPSPLLFAGTTEASDREDSAFQSQDEKAETSQQDKFKITDVFDYVSGDELPTLTMNGTKEKKKAMLMEEVSGRAVQRVLEDEMLHVADASDAPGKNSRKGAKPIKWGVRLRTLSPGGLATSPRGGTIPSDAAAATPDAKPVEEVAATKPRRVTRTAQAPKPKRTPQAELTPQVTQSGAVLCPIGCGRVYSKRTSAFYSHRLTCTGAPT